MGDEDLPIHEQVYRAVVDTQESEKRRDSAWQPSGQFAARSSPAAIGGLLGAFVAAFAIETHGIVGLILAPLCGVLVGAACGWLFGRACRFVFRTVPAFAILGLQRLWRAHKHHDS